MVNNHLIWIWTWFLVNAPRIYWRTQDMICLSNSDISAFVSLSFFFLPQTVMVMGDSKEGVAYSSWCILARVMERDQWSEHVIYFVFGSFSVALLYFFSFIWAHCSASHFHYSIFLLQIDGLVVGLMDLDRNVGFTMPFLIIFMEWIQISCLGMSVVVFLLDKIDDDDPLGRG